MKTNVRKVLSWISALTLFLTCAVSGLVLPTAAEETNLMTNGDFEQGASVAWGNSAYVMDGIGVGGSKGVKIETTVNEGDAAIWPGVDYKAAFHAILEPNTTYVFSFDYKSEGKGFAKFDINRVGTDWTGGWADVNLPAAAEWTTHTIEFTTGAAENMNANTGWEWAVRRMHYANAANYGTGVSWFDNFSLTKKAAKPAASVELDKTALQLQVGQSDTLTATFMPVGSVGEGIVWTTSDAAVATVDENGKITAVAMGTATITATAGTLSASCTVTVGAKADALTITPNEATVLPGGSVTLAVVATPLGADKGVLTWTSSDATIATVDQNGTVSAVAESGTVTITVSNEDGKSATASVTIDPYANLLPNGNLELGAAETFEHLPSEGVSVEDGVGIDGSKALKFSKSYNLPTIYLHQMDKVTLMPHSRYVLSLWTKGPSIRISYTNVTDITPVNSDTKVWATKGSTDEWVETQVIFDTGAAPSMNSNWGFYFKQATAGVSADTYVDNVTLKKQPSATSITIVPSEVELLPEDMVTLIVSTLPENSSFGKLTWTSSNTAVAEVSQDGVVTAKRVSGTATITVTSSTGLTDTCTVTVDEYGNVLKNGDFEQIDRNWNSDAKGSIKPGIGKDGSYGLELTNPEGSSNSTFYKLPLPVLPGMTYEISFDYLATPDADFRIWSGNLGLVSPVPESGDGTEWKHASGLVTTPADMLLNPGWDLSILSRAQGKTPAVIDNVCLRLYKSGVAAESVAINYTKLTMIPGRTQALALTATPASGDLNGTVWTSSDENVAMVEYGIVTAIGKGTATITGTTKNGKSATCVVTVSGDEALIGNGTFDKENDASWTMDGGAAIVEGEGRAESDAAMLVKNATLSQTVTGLRPNTVYQLSFRYRSVSGTVSVKLQNGEAALLQKATDAVGKWAVVTYEFTTPETLSDTSTLTLTTAGNGPIYVDNLWLAQKASLVDFIINDVFWDGGDEQVLTGTKLTFALTVTNQGEDTVPAGSVVEVDIAVDTKVVQTLEYVCSTAVAQGESFIVMGTEPWAATEGDLVISARVNPRLMVSETNTVNNALQVHLRVADTLLEAPELAQKAGFDKLIFSDEFDSIDSIDTLATGAEGYKWYVTRNWAAGTVTREEYDVEDGILTLKNDGSYGITLSSVDVNTGNGFGWNKGYLEVRLRIPKPEVTGGGPNVWSFPLGKALEIPGQNSHWVEMDWMEFWGITDRYDQGYWTVTLHDMIRPDGAPEVSDWISNTGNGINALGDKEWHVLSWVWDVNLVQGYMDGVKMFEITYDEESMPSSTTNVHKGDLRNGIFSALNEQVNCLYLSGYATNPMEVDWVRIWQGEGGGITPGGEEEDEGGVIADIAAEDFWYNYCTDNWGDLITVVTEENYLNVLGYVAETESFDAAVLWGALSEERKAEINALLKENGQPSYDELLAAALAIAEGGEPTPDTPDTGEVTAVPLAMVMLLSSVSLLAVVRKRRKG